ncbi:MAG: VCBS repeat-containing protein [Anaerolineae bacterium]|nr:VCBS repeat-containing protein [Anaerolineae bacterium]
MTKTIKRLLNLMVLLAAASQISLAHAQDGIVLDPYWTFRTDAPVTHIETGDIDGDGEQEIVAATVDSVIYVLENDGALAWSYEKEGVVLDVLVDNLDSDEQTDEIYVGGAFHDVILSDAERPVWTYEWRGSASTIAAVAVDMDGDGQREILLGSQNSVNIVSWVRNTYHPGDFALDLSSVDFWVGDTDGDEKLEIVPSPAGGSQISVLDDTGHRVWQKDIDGEVGLVQVGDVDGDGQAEVVVLNTTWEMFLFDNKGNPIWQQPAISAQNITAKPEPGQLLVQDLDGDGRMEIVVIAAAPATVAHVFDGQGNQLWQHPLEDISSQARLVAGDINADGVAELVVIAEGQQQFYLLDGTGRRLGTYRLPSLATFAGPLNPKTTGAVAYADLDGAGGGEIIVGTEAGVTVFGASNQVVYKEQWASPRLGLTVSNLYLNDLDNDGHGEVVVASKEGWLYILDNEGQIQSQVDLEVPLFGLSAADVDGDGQRGLAVATTGMSGKVYLLDGDQPLWATPQKSGIISGLAGADVDGDNRAEIIVGGRLPDGWVRLLDSQGEERWQVELADPVTAVGSAGGLILAGTAGGHLYYLTTEGDTLDKVDLGAEILSIDRDLAVTAGGQVFDLGDGGPTLAYELGEAPDRIQVGPVLAMTSRDDNKVSLVSDDGVVWQGVVDGRAVSLATGDLNNDDVIEIAVGTDAGRVHLFGLTLDQPPLLPRPDLAETRDGYAYSVEVIDPEADAVPVTLEIWDPSANDWLAQAAQSLEVGQTRGGLVWGLTEPFDIWDAGQESRFRFVYEFGDQQISTSEVSGPFNIPTTPWYLYYGQRVGLGTLMLLVPALGWVLYRRQRIYRRSPAGQGEALLKQLKAQPDKTLTTLQTLTHDNPSILPYLSGAAREAGETAVADLSEGYNLLLARPEITAEDLRAIVDAIRRLDGPSDEQKTRVIDRFDWFRRALEANTVNRIVALSVRFHEFSTRPDAKLGQALNDLNAVIKTLSNFQRVEAFADKTAYLGQALEALGRLEREFRANMGQPEGNILARIAANWLLAVNNALQDLQGRAQIEATLKTRRLLRLDQASLSLELTNTGHSPASNVTVSLGSDQPFAVGNGTARLDVLAAGRSAMVELPISAAASVEQFRAEFNITFDDQERSGKTLAFADIVQRLRPTTPFRSLPNPYAPGTPLAPGSPIFFGRADLFEFVGQNLAGLTRQNILVLIGQRRMGKTSFLQQLSTRLGEEYLPVYLDGQSLGIDPGMAHFFYDVALAIVDALNDQGLAIEEPEPADFEERPSGAFERTFLPLIFEAIGERQLLFLFDEFEELEMRVTSGKLEPTIFPFLRHLMQHNSKLGFIFVGTHRLEALSTDYWSVFFNIALYKHVVFLSEMAARSLITEPVAEYGLIYDDLALDKIVRVTAGHPYFLQLTCHGLVNHANREQRGYLTIRDVNSVLDEMVELGEAHFAFLWEQSTPTEQLILSTLTRLLSREPTVTAIQVIELLAERGITRDGQAVTETLRRLVERDIIRELAGQPPRYEYKVELVRLWIERYKALGRIVEEIDR